VPVTVAYRRSWDGDLAGALAGSRSDDVRRGVNTVGPHRDDVDLAIGERPARLQASQGEQRTLALALRLGAHQLATARSGRPPILLLDDVFSELDRWRSRALVEELPPGQALVTTAVPLPDGVEVARTLDVRELRGHPGSHPDGPPGAATPGGAQGDGRRS
jgi:DNA replication and repair protein RecF